MNKKSGSKKAILDAASLGIFIAVSVSIGLIAGNWLDGKIGTSPLFLIIGFLAGVVSAGMEVWRIVKKSSREDK
jgi:F0F1-type ATP synthase assembly protein I